MGRSLSYEDCPGSYSVCLVGVFFEQDITQPSVGDDLYQSLFCLGAGHSLTDLFGSLPDQFSGIPHIKMLV